MRLIDADALEQSLTEKGDDYKVSMFATADDCNIARLVSFECAEEVKNATAIDAVPVVRCKDCMFARKVDSRREPKWKCVHSIWDGCTQWRESNFYCAYGEKNSAKMDLEEK